MASDGGQLRGIAAQSIVKGLTRALDIIVELANYEEEEKSNE